VKGKIELIPLNTYRPMIAFCERCALKFNEISECFGQVNNCLRSSYTTDLINKLISPEDEYTVVHNLFMQCSSGRDDN
jgi:hypothetical protein